MRLLTIIALGATMTSATPIAGPLLGNLLGGATQLQVNYLQQACTIAAKTPNAENINNCFGQVFAVVNEVEPSVAKHFKIKEVCKTVQALSPDLLALG